jgi:NAD(P)-dependent dehydrogenase (short-subunit alcohol dehydrogenase family)
MGSLDGKVALVTGAGSGIGQAAARMYAREGARVMVSDVAETAAQATAAHIQAVGGQARVVLADVADPAQHERLVRETVAGFGRLDIAFNNAGIGGESAPVADYSLEGWQQVININLSGVFYGMKYQLPAMLATGGGAIVNMASVLGQVGFPNAPAYVAAKHGVIGLTRSAALDYAGRGLRVNAVGPGFISTPLISGLEADPEANQMLIGLHPLGRLGTADEVAEAVVWLSSDAAAFITGAYLPIDGGYLAR